jgi:hypothetical protein
LFFGLALRTPGTSFVTRVDTDASSPAAINAYLDGRRVAGTQRLSGASSEGVRVKATVISIHQTGDEPISMGQSGGAVSTAVPAPLVQVAAAK